MPDEGTDDDSDARLLRAWTERREARARERMDEEWMEEGEWMREWSASQPPVFTPAPATHARREKKKTNLLMSSSTGLIGSPDGSIESPDEPRNIWFLLQNFRKQSPMATN